MHLLLIFVNEKGLFICFELLLIGLTKGVAFVNGQKLIFGAK